MFKFDEIRGGSSWGAATYAGADNSRTPTGMTVYGCEATVRRCACTARALAAQAGLGLWMLLPAFACILHRRLLCAPLVTTWLLSWTVPASCVAHPSTHAAPSLPMQLWSLTLLATRRVFDLDIL